LRQGVLAVLAFVLLACDTGGQASASPTPTPAPNPADTRASDLRTHLDLLLGEQVMLVAKQAVAAINQTDDYQSYTALLATNTADLTELMRRAFGNTTATTLAASWDTQNAYLVDYTIGVATHNDTRSKAAMSDLTQKFVPQFSTLMSDASRLPLDPVTLLLSQQVLEDKAFIDDYAAKKWETFYSDLHRAYAQSARFGDALAVEIAHRYPDKFPGDAELRAVNVRVAANTGLQELSYLETMATAAKIAGREPDYGFAVGAVTTRSKDVAAVFATALGQDSVALANALADEMLALKGYATGENGKDVVIQNAGKVATLANVSKQHSTDHVNALVKVVDDQKAKSFASIADDDRTAATSTQSMADAIRG
jgi:hypothetical protein